jgi:hypothetical protein
MNRFPLPMMVLIDIVVPEGNNCMHMIWHDHESHDMVSLLLQEIKPLVHCGIAIGQLK